MRELFRQEAGFRMRMENAMWYFPAIPEIYLCHESDINSHFLSMLISYCKSAWFGTTFVFSASLENVGWMPGQEELSASCQ